MRLTKYSVDGKCVVYAHPNTYGTCDLCNSQIDPARLPWWMRWVCDTHRAEAEAWQRRARMRHALGENA